MNLEHPNLEPASLDEAIAVDAPALPASRHYRRARQDRGAETKQKLLIAALDVFGRYGFEGSATRDIAKRAEANLAAIVYHFGSKDALHRAVAEYVVGQMSSRIGGSIDAAATALKGEVDRPQARRLLQDIIEANINSMLGEAESELWGRFIMREQMEPSSAFDVIYDFMVQSHTTTTHLVAILLGLDPRSEEATLRAFAISGQFVIFRVGQPMILRKLERAELTVADRHEILRIITTNIDTLVGETLTREG